MHARTPPKGDVPTSPETRFACKVYYEDTDCMGVVYHANYLKFLERARTEFLSHQGESVARLQDEGTLFVVYRLDVTFRAPARLGDELEVITRAKLTSPYRVTFEQRIECPKRQKKPLLLAEVEIVAIDQAGSIKPIPNLGF